jgi:hyperosmotically inducible protein
MASVVALLFVSAAPIQAPAQQTPNPRLKMPDEREMRPRATLVAEVQRQLLRLPNYGVFDWLEAAVEPDGVVVLRGQVVRPTLKSDAEANVKRIESVSKVLNEIEILPLSTFDDETRVAVYRSLAAESSLTKYFIQAVPPIHIIVRNGNVTLKGVTASTMDRQLAYMAASRVPNVFKVQNELIAEKPEEPIS